MDGNVNSTSFEMERAGLPDSKINQGAVVIVVDDEIWPCGLILCRADAASDFAPWASGTNETGMLAVLDEETDTSKTGSAFITRFGAVRKDLLKVGVAAPADPSAALLFALEEQHIYGV